jgi:glycosyltransferase involved in cell wall biosynthesis
VKAQIYPPNAVVIVDDMANVNERMIVDILAPIQVRFVYPLWHLGVAHAFNFGVACAPADLVFMLGSDDTLEPECLAECSNAYYAAARPNLSYYWVGVRYMHGEYPDQYLPCHAAMVSKELWKHTGGLPVEAASGASDAALISILMGQGERAGDLVCVDHNKPLYNYRVHDETDTASKGAWQGVIIETRNILTRDWTPPKWQRYV